MKILLDECLPLDFRHSFPDHDTHTAQWAGVKGKKMATCCWLPSWRVMTCCSKINQIEDLLPFVGAILNALTTITPGQIVSTSS
jgi:hypothetical protein